MQNNWTQQLSDLKIGQEIEFNSEFYDTIISTRQRLERNKKGTWQTKKEYRANTFIVRRTS